MDTFYRIVALLGGLALFLYGMRIMGDGLKSSSGGAMKAALAKVTNRPVMGFLLGLIVTCMIQSSTATIVLTVGLVGAGFLTFRQSIGIVFGANVGTAITAQIIRLMDLNAGSGSILYFFKSDNLAPMALIVGIILIMFIHKKSAASAGTIFIGFGILFVGLMNMSAAVSSMSDSLSKMLISFEDNYLLGFFAGVFVTCIIQSSSAVVGILQSLASTMGVTFSGVFAIIIGVNIGDCLTTYLVCRLGATPEQRRVCVVHILYNICAAILIVAVLAITKSAGLLDSTWNMTMNSGGVANVHGMFRLLPAVCLLPFTGLFAGVAQRIVRDRPEDEEDSKYEEAMRKLDPRLIQNPRLALNETELLMRNMADIALHNYQAVAQQLYEFDPTREDRVRKRERTLDQMTDAANQYLVQLSPFMALEKDRNDQSFQMRTIMCFERIGDISVNITDNVTALMEAGKDFSPMAKKEIKVALDAVDEILEISVKAFENNDIELAKQVEPLEEVIDELVEDLHARHVHRMTHDLCDIFSGIQFQNILLSLGRVSDQCSDIALYLLGRDNPAINGNEHKFLHDLHHSNDTEYTGLFNTSYTKYFDRLNKIDPLQS